MKDKLNPRQKKFAEYYAKNGNAAKSAREAGYSKTYAEHRTDELLGNVEIAEYIKQLSDKFKEERIISAKDRQIILSDIAKSKEEFASDRIRAIDTLNKMTGEYLNKVEISGTLKAEQTKLDDLIRQMNEGD